MPEGLELLGGVALTRGEFERAVRLLGAAEARREASGTVRQPVFRDPYAHHVAVAQSALGAAAFAEAWAAGKAMTPEDATEEALTIAGVPIEPSNAVPDS